MEQNQNGLSQFGLSPEALTFLAQLEEQERQERLRLDVGTLNYVHGHLEDFINDDLKIVCRHISQEIMQLDDLYEDIVYDNIYLYMVHEILGIIEAYDAIEDEILTDMEEQAGQPEANPCDYPDNEGHFNCPFDANGPDDCRRNCGLGVDE